MRRACSVWTRSNWSMRGFLRAWTRLADGWQRDEPRDRQPCALLVGANFLLPSLLSTHTSKRTILQPEIVKVWQKLALSNFPFVTALGTGFCCVWLCRLSDRSVSHMGMGRLPRSFRAYNRIERRLQRRKHRRWLKRARARITATRRSLEANSLHDSIAQNAASNPLAPPPPAAPPAVFVRMIPRRGRALVAARCSAGETILAEQPNVVVPMADDVGNALVCSRCLAFLGDTDMHLGLAAGRISIAAARAEIALGDSSQCFECGALYCGSECRVADVARGHRLLCPGGGGSSRGEADADGRAPDSKSMVAARMDDTRLNAAAAWERFRRHAREEAELPELELAATLLAAVLISETGMCTSETLEACVPLLLVQEPVATVLSRDAAGAEAAASTLREVETSCNLCRAAMILTCGAAGVAKASVRRRCTMTGTNSFGNLVGLAFLNQVAVTVSSPAETLRSTSWCGLTSWRR